VNNTDPFVEEPVDTHEEIMYATFAALQEYGYAELSIQYIADEVQLSKSTLYHHFADKDDLILSFLQFLLNTMEGKCQYGQFDNPKREVLEIVDKVLEENITPQPSSEGAIMASYIELRAQAIRNPTHREPITEADQQFVEQVATLIEAGIRQGVFQTVDPEETAEFLLAMLHGIIIQSITRHDGPLPQLQSALKNYLRAELFLNPPRA